MSQIFLCHLKVWWILVKIYFEIVGQLVKDKIDWIAHLLTMFDEQCSFTVGWFDADSERPLDWIKSKWIRKNLAHGGLSILYTWHQIYLYLTNSSSNWIPNIKSHVQKQVDKKESCTWGAFYTQCHQCIYVYWKTNSSNNCD